MKLTTNLKNLNQVKLTNFQTRLVIFLVIWLILEPLFFSAVSEAFHLKDYAIANFTFYLIPIALILVIYFKYNELNEYNYKQNRIQTIAFAFIVLQFLLLYLNLTLVAKFLYVNYEIAWEWLHLLIIYGTTLLMELSLFLAIFNLNFLKKFKKYAATFLLIVIAYCVLLYTLSIYSNFFSYLVVIIVVPLLKLFFPQSGIIIQGDTIGIYAEKFIAGVGPTCAGIESILLFALLYALFVVFRLKNPPRNKAIHYFAIGIIGAFTLNIIRVFAIIAIGTQHPQFAIGAFHNNAGWLLFVAYFLLFTYVVFPKLRPIN